MDYAKELEFAKQLAGEAGLIMQKYYRANQHVETKSDHTPVTIADKEVNQMVIDRVKAEYPDNGILGEELSWQSDRKKLWVCDPIDGTPAFIYHLPTSMFSLALVMDGEPQVGVAFNPWTGELYSAVKRNGAFRDEQPIEVSHRTWGDATRLAGSSDGSLDRTTSRKEFEELDINVIASYSIVFKGCLVAEGSVDGRIWAGNGAHDVAAVSLIVEEAGGKATDLEGNQQRYDGPINGIIMSNGLIHDELIKIAKASA